MSSRSRNLILVVAGRHDRRARSLVERWSGSGANLLTCEDLSVAGWRYTLNDPENSTVVIGAQSIAADEIAGVLTRLPYVPERELFRIAREDRRYVAAEMTAFLRSWLSTLPCPVLNRPVPTSLSGPGWCHEQWVHAAARLAIPVRTVRRRIAFRADAREAEPVTPNATVTVVGERCLGTANSVLAAQARRLARAARVDLLSVRFGGSEDELKLIGADAWPDTSSPEVADAILEYLTGGGRC
jgi:hypothetical protein